MFAPAQSPEKALGNLQGETARRPAVRVGQGVYALDEGPHLVRELAQQKTPHPPR